MTTYSVRVGRFCELHVQWREHSRHNNLQDAEWMSAYLRLVKCRCPVSVWKVVEDEEPGVTRTTGSVHE